MTASKIDVKKSTASYLASRGAFRILDVPTMQYLMIDGEGDPNTSPAFTEAIETLYPLAYKLKFMSKVTLSKDYVVPPLEGLWWADDMGSFTTTRDKTLWKWTLLLMTPPWVTSAHFDEVTAGLEQKGAAPPRLPDVRLENFSEGLCVQTLHVGSFDQEASVLAQMHDSFLPSNNLTMTGKHHEIYFSDFRRTAPEKQRTILRQPVLCLE